jgi:hypothetical protein
MKLCPCGSGKPRYELRDAADIFCAFICDDCEKEKVARFNPAIFEPRSQYAATGNEWDIGIEENA